MSYCRVEEKKTRGTLRLFYFTKTFFRDQRVIFWIINVCKNVINIFRSVNNEDTNAKYISYILKLNLSLEMKVTKKHVHNRYNQICPLRY